MIRLKPNTTEYFSHVKFLEEQSHNHIDTRDSGSTRVVSFRFVERVPVFLCLSADVTIYASQQVDSDDPTQLIYESRNFEDRDTFERMGQCGSKIWLRKRRKLTVIEGTDGQVRVHETYQGSCPTLLKSVFAKAVDRSHAAHLEGYPKLFPAAVDYSGSNPLSIHEGGNNNKSVDFV